MGLLQDPLQFVAFFVALIASITVHEFAHALIADALGDRTARSLGRVTLNPLKHLDPMGTIMMLVVALGGIGLGWGKPVPVNAWNLRIGAKRGMALVALAGPVSNLLLAAVAGRILTLSSVGTSPFEASLSQDLLWTVLIVNVSLAVFNMLPIPPLDGFRVLVGALPDRPAYSLARLEQYGPGILLLVVVLGMGVVGRILNAVAVPIVSLLLI